MGKNQVRSFTVSTIVIATILSLFCGCDSKNYRTAMELYDLGEYSAARLMFSEIDDQKSREMVMACDYGEAIQLFDMGQYQYAENAFKALNTYEQSEEYINRCEYQMAVEEVRQGQYITALERLEKINELDDSENLLKQCKYHVAKDYYDEGNYEAALTLFSELGDFEDAVSLTTRCIILRDPIQAICEQIEKSGTYISEIDAYCVSKMYVSNGNYYLLSCNGELTFVDIVTKTIYSEFEKTFICTWNNSNTCTFSLEYFDADEYSVCEGTIDKCLGKIMMCYDTISGRAALETSERNKVVLKAYEHALDFLEEYLDACQLDITIDEFLLSCK